MPRKGPAPRRDLMPDPIYRSVLVTQIVNKILMRGKRTLSERIVYEALGHRLLPALAPETHHPANREGRGPAGPDLDGDLVRGATDPAAAHLELGLHVVDGPLERLQRVATGLLADDLQRVVHDGLGQRALPAHQDLVDDLRHEHRPVDRVGHEIAPRGRSLAGHGSSYFSRLAP